MLKNCFKMAWRNIARHKAFQQIVRLHIAQRFKLRPQFSGITNLLDPDSAGQ